MCQRRIRVFFAGTRKKYSHMALKRVPAVV